MPCTIKIPPRPSVEISHDLAFVNNTITVHNLTRNQVCKTPLKNRDESRWQVSTPPASPALDPRRYRNPMHSRSKNTPSQGLYTRQRCDRTMRPLRGFTPTHSDRNAAVADVDALATRSGVCCTHTKPTHSPTAHCNHSRHCVSRCLPTCLAANKMHIAIPLGCHCCLGA